MSYEKPQQRSRFAWYAGDVEFLDPAPKKPEEEEPKPEKKKKIIVRKDP